MPLTPGSRLGNYEIVSVLGSGGMGEVYRARDSRLGRDIALKILPTEMSAHPDRLARFEREAKTVAGLNHPNIVTLHSIEEANGAHFLTLELVDGESLDRQVVAGGMSVGKLLALAIPMTEALVAAHERGVVHRDLKPANVMVTRDGRLKVLDFGLAKAATADSGLEATQAATIATPISTAGQVVGTVPYMAPEQVRGETVDARSDLFALGVMMYELLAGVRPFGGSTFADVSSSILRDAPDPLAVRRGDLPADLVRIVGRCLEKEPRDRFQTALDVRNELRLVQRALESAGSSSKVWAVKPEAVPASEALSIAIMPFANRSRDQEDEYFADGLADELLSVLGKIRGLRVAARTSTFSFRGKDATIAEIGRALNVVTVLEGSIRKAGNRVRISVQLVKVADGYHLWTETYDRTLDDIFAVQDDIAQSVVKELRTTLLGEEPDSRASGEVKAEVARAARGRSADPEAHQYFVQGRFLAGRISPVDILPAVGYLERAVARDPDYALAWAWLGRARVLAAGWGELPVVSGNESAREAIQRALALDPELADAHLALGMLRNWYDWDWAGAEEAYTRALQRAPEQPEILAGLSMLQFGFARGGAALEYAERALALDPLNVNSWALIGRAYRINERHADAEAAFRRILELSPGAMSARTFLAIRLAEEEKFDEAREMVALEGSEWARLFGSCIIDWWGGDREASDRALARQIKIGSESSAYQLAVMHAVRGQADAAFEWLDRGYTNRDSGLFFSRSEPLLRSLHGDPRWTAHIRRMKLEG